MADPRPATAPARRAPLLRQLRLQTARLDELGRFYGDTLGLPPAPAPPGSIAFDAGATRLEFEAAAPGLEPYYHVAFNIPERKLAGARRWLAERLPILRHARTGEEVVHFAGWNAHSLFFYDPAGSLLELIARHTLPDPDDGPFGDADLLYASEIGLVPRETAPAFALIRDRLGIEPYLGAGTFLGDETGLIIVIPPDQLWIPEYTKTGRPFRTRIAIAGPAGRSLRLPDGPIEIVSAP
jgi:hypothetical protein